MTDAMGPLDADRLADIVGRHWKYTVLDDGTLRVWFNRIDDSPADLPITFSLHGEAKAVLQIRAWDEDRLQRESRLAAMEACSKYCQAWRWPRPYVGLERDDGSFAVVLEGHLSAAAGVSDALLDEFITTTVSGIWRFWGLAHGEYALFPGGVRASKPAQIDISQPSKSPLPENRKGNMPELHRAPSPAPRDPTTFELNPPFVVEACHFARVLYKMAMTGEGWDQVSAAYTANQRSVEQAAREALGAVTNHGREEFARQLASFAAWMGNRCRTPTASFCAATAVVARDLIPDETFKAAYAPFEEALPSYFYVTFGMNSAFVTDYGPFQPQLFAFVQRLALFDATQWQAVAEYWESPRRDPAVDAQRGMMELARDRHRIIQANAAEEATYQCTLLTAIRLGAGDHFDESKFALQSVVPAELAAAALVVRDLIGEKRFAAIYSPFAALIPLP